jgi:hypothetical protein
MEIISWVAKFIDLIATIKISIWSSAIYIFLIQIIHPSFSSKILVLFHIIPYFSKHINYRTLPKKETLHQQWVQTLQGCVKAHHSATTLETSF